MKNFLWLLLLVHTCNAYKNLAISVNSSLEEKSYIVVEAEEEVSNIRNVEILNVEEMKEHKFEKVIIANLTADYVPVVLKKFPTVLSLKMENVGDVDFRKLFPETVKLQELAGSGNKCPAIRADSLKNVPMLALLYFDSNQIIEIDQNAFGNKKALVAISLSKNKIEKIKSKTFSVPSLLALDLSLNKIEIIENYAFQGAKKMTKLILNNNKIVEFFPNSFAGLSFLIELGLSQNSIKALPNGGFKDLTKLEKLLLGENKIKTLSKESFEGLTQLSGLAIHKNAITQLTARTFEHCHQMEILYLGENLIDTVDADAFYDLHKLRKLHLAHNRIRRIENETFQNTPELAVLDLTGNLIETIDSDTFSGCDQLETLSFLNNSLVAISPEAFSNLKHLESLYMDGNICFHDTESFKYESVKHQLGKCFRGYEILQKYNKQSELKPKPIHVSNKLYLTMAVVCFALIILGFSVTLLLVVMGQKSEKLISDASNKIDSLKNIDHLYEEYMSIEELDQGESSKVSPIPQQNPL